MWEDPWANLIAIKKREHEEQQKQDAIEKKVRLSEPEEDPNSDQADTKDTEAPVAAAKSKDASSDNEKSASGSESSDSSVGLKVYD